MNTSIQLYKNKEILTGTGSDFSTVLFNDTIRLNSSSKGSSNEESCHQVEPLPSMIPVP